jgi:hypothetical protein
MARDRLVASLTIRCASSAVPEAEAVRRFVPRLRVVAQKIGQEFTAQNEHDSAAAAAADAARLAASGAG